MNFLFPRSKEICKSLYFCVFGYVISSYFHWNYFLSKNCLNLKSEGNNSDDFKLYRSKVNYETIPSLIKHIEEYRMRASELMVEISKLDHIVEIQKKIETNNSHGISDLNSNSFFKTNRVAVTILKAMKGKRNKVYYSRNLNSRHVGGKLVEYIFRQTIAKNKNIGLIRAKQYFSDPDIKVEDFKQNQRIWIILPLFKRVQMFKRFLSTLSDAVAKFNGDVVLRPVLHRDKEGEWEKNKELYMAMRTALIVDPILTDKPFNRAFSAHLGTTNVTESDILIFMDVDMVFDEYFLARVLLNTVLGKQVYFPICFSQYNPKIRCFGKEICDPNYKNVSNSYGYWRDSGYGMVSMYKADYTRTGGFDTSIKGWGTEDVDLFFRCYFKGLTRFRAIDPSLIHVYHPKTCNKSLPPKRYHDCLKSCVFHSGDIVDLYKIFIKLRIRRLH